MTKRERLEDLGKLSMMLRDIVNHDIFMHTDSKHGYEEWVKENHDKIEYGEPKGLGEIFCNMRWLRDKLDDCLAIAYGDDDEY